MRGIITLLVCLLSFCQAPTSAHPRASGVLHFSVQTENHSKPINHQQENQEENELTDEDEDFSDETIYSLEYGLPPSLFYKNILIEIYLMNEASAHVNPILTPPDRMP
jgi:hypothetical protein